MFFIKQLFFMLFSHWGKSYATNQFKKRGLLFYLKMLQAVRFTLMGFVAFICLLQLMIIGLVGTFVTSVFLTNGELNTKLWTLLAGFLLILVVPIVGLTVMFSQRLWYQMSGAEEFFATEAAKAKEQDQPEPPNPTLTPDPL